MVPSPSDNPFRGDSHDGALAGEAAAFEGDQVDLAALVRQRDAFRGDVSRIEAALARETATVSPGLYELLLRYRRISDKLENRILFVRLRQERPGGT
jgi:hypothetical protein